MKNASKSRCISTLSAPQAIGPYSQAVSYGDLLFVSGILPIDAKTGVLHTGNIESEVRLVLENLKAIVEAGGMGLCNVLKTTVYLKDLEDFKRFNEIYNDYFADILPARETIQASRLPRDASVEISAICGK